MKKFLLLVYIFIIGSFQFPFFAIADVDYSNPNNWLAIPTKNEYSTDVFYVYPTVCMKGDADNICKYENLQMQNSAKQVFKLQAEAFSTVANIYAPFYSQYNFNAFSYSDYNEIQKRLAQNTKGISDIYNALDFYFKKYNQNRPFILVSHSQGSGIMLIVLSDYMKQHPEYYKNMVAAYVIGYPVTKEYMSQNLHLKFAKKSNDTGVIISYDVEAPNKSGIDIFKTKNKLVINPINWSRSERIAKASQNLGSLNEHTLQVTTPGIADAKINKKSGMIICSTVDSEKYEIKLPALFGKGSFHGQDFQFYFLNLRQNAKERIDNFNR